MRLRRRPTAAAAVLVALVALAGGCATEGGSPTIAGPDTTGAGGPAATGGAGSDPETGGGSAPAVLPVTLSGGALSGRADVTYQGTELCIGGVVDGLAGITALEVRSVPDGAPVISFPPASEVEGSFSGCADVGAEGGVVVEDPAAYEVVVVTAEAPDGAVRGALSGG